MNKICIWMYSGFNSCYFVCRMPMTISYLITLASTLLLFNSCGNKTDHVITFDLSPRDFIEIINAPGTVRASNTLTVVAPRLRVSGITVIYIADEGEYVKMGDTICILDAPDLIQQHERITSRLERLNMDLNKLTIDNDINLSSLESQLDDMNIRIAMNSLDSVQKQFAPPVQQRLFALELEKANVEKSKLQKRYSATRLIFEAERKSYNSRIISTENNMQRVIEQINSLTIVAPQEGIVLHTVAPQMRMMSSRGVMTIGGKIGLNSSVFPNMPLLQMPDVSEMEVLLEVPEADYRQIMEGQKVIIDLDALSGLQTTGEIKRKTLAGNSRGGQSSVKLYEVIVSIDSLHHRLTHGISAACEIVVNEVKGAVVIPATAVFKKDSLNIVYVANGDKFLPVPVEIGLSNSSSTIVSNGIEGTETIALIEPPYNVIERKVISNSKSPSTADSTATGIFKN